MAELIRRAYLRARATGATVYGWPTYARLALSDTVPDAGSCGGRYVSVSPSGRIERLTYRPYRTAPGWRIWKVEGYR